MPNGKDFLFVYFTRNCNRYPTSKNTEPRQGIPYFVEKLQGGWRRDGLERTGEQGVLTP